MEVSQYGQPWGCSFHISRCRDCNKLTAPTSMLWNPSPVLPISSFQPVSEHGGEYQGSPFPEYRALCGFARPTLDLHHGLTLPSLPPSFPLPFSSFYPSFPLFFTQNQTSLVGSWFSQPSLAPSSFPLIGVSYNVLVYYSCHNKYYRLSGFNEGNLFSHKSGR